MGRESRESKSVEKHLNDVERSRQAYDRKASTPEVCQ
jgi:hypothetical protein